MKTPIRREVQCWQPPMGFRTLSYWEWGDPRADEVVVCVHGLTRQGRDFDQLAQRLSGRFRVICPDVAGRGYSSPLSDPMAYQIPTYVADMIVLLARLDARRLHWVGTSMGGLIGMVLAGAHPSPVERLVLNDVGPRIQWQALSRIGQYVGMRHHFPSKEAAAAMLRVLAAGFGPHTDDEWMALTEPQLRPAPEGGFVLHYDTGLAQPFLSVTEESIAQGEAAAWAAYDAIRARVLLIRGADSDLLSRETALEMTQRGPRAQLVEWAGIGHAPTLVQASQIDVVQEFLEAT